MESSRTLLTLVRHGQTSANLDGVWHGSTNTPLTEHGRGQAAAAAAFIEANYKPVGSVYASPLDRAHNTAEPIAERLGLVPRIDSDLTEYDLQLDAPTHNNHADVTVHVMWIPRSLVNDVDDVFTNSSGPNP